MIVYLVIGIGILIASLIVFNKMNDTITFVDEGHIEDSILWGNDTKWDTIKHWILTFIFK